jgi:hypothetical protein
MADWRGRLVQRYIVIALVCALLALASWRFLDAPGWMAALTGLVLFCFAAIFPAVQTPLEQPTIARKSGGGANTALDAALAEAEPALHRIDRFVADMPRNLVRDRFSQLSETAHKIIAEVKQTPQLLAPVQRLLTYYLPRAAELGDTYRALRTKGVEAPERLQSIEDVLGKMIVAFDHYSEQLLDEDMRALDADIRLVNEALREDVGDKP